MSGWFASKWFAGKYLSGWFGEVALVPAPVAPITIKREPVVVGARFIRCGPAGTPLNCPPVSKEYASFKAVRRPGKGVKPLDPKITEKRTKEYRDRVKAQELRSLRAKLHELRKMFKDTVRALETERAKNTEKFEAIKNRFTYRWAPARFPVQRLFRPAYATQVEKTFVPQPQTIPEKQILVSTPTPEPSPWALAALAALPWSAAATVALLGTALLVPEDEKTVKFAGYSGAALLFAKAIESGLETFVEQEILVGPGAVAPGSRKVAKHI